MNVKGGALEFDIVANNGQMNSALDETKKRIQGLSKTSVSAGDDMAQMFDATSENIRIQKQVIKDLENQYRELTAEIKKVAPGLGQSELQSQANQVKQELDAEKESLNQLEVAVKQNEGAQASYRSQLRAAREELTQMEQAGQRGTEAYAKLQAEVGRLKDAMDDAGQQAKVLANDERMFQGVVSAISGITGGFSAAQGAVALFAGENENLNRIMLKVQSLMAITIGLQQVAETLNKDSYFRIVLVSKAQSIYAATTRFLGTAFIQMGMSATAAKIAVAGLYATLTLGLSLAISGVIALIERHNAAQEEEKQKAQEVNETLKKQEDRLNNMAKSYAEQQSQITALRAALNSENISYKDKLKIISKLKEIIPGYTARLSGEGKVLWENKAAVDAYLASLERTLRFKAAMEDLTTQYSELYKVEKKARKGGSNSLPVTKGKIMGQNTEIWDYDKLAQQHGLKNASYASPQMLETWKKQAQGLAGITDQIYTKQKKTIQANIDDIVKYITDNNLVDIATGKSSGGGKGGHTGGGGGTKEDPFIQLLENRKKQYDQYAKWINSTDESIRKAANVEFADLIKDGGSYQEYLTNLRAKLQAAPASPKTDSYIKKVTDELVALENGNYMDAWKKSLEDELGLTGNLIEKLDILAQKRKDLANDNSGLKGQKETVIDSEQNSIAEEALKEAGTARKQLQEYNTAKLDYETSYMAKRKALSIKAEQETNAARKQIYLNAISALDDAHTLKDQETYDKLINDYKTYEQKRVDIAADYDKKIALAQKEGNGGLVNQLQAAKGKALMQNSMDELKASPEYTKAFEDLKNTSTETLNYLLAKFEAVKQSAGENLNPEDLKEYFDTIQNITGELIARDPFKAIADGYKELQDASKQLKAAEKELADIRNAGGTGTDKEEAAIKKVNAAKDNYIKKNNQVKRSEKTASDAVKDLSSALSDVGNSIGGEAGQIISLIGDIGSFVMGAISGFQTAATASAGAISTLEKASVILTIISAAFQLANKVASMFGADYEEYNKAKEAYEAYIDVLDDVIAKQKELVETMSGENAVNSYKYAVELIKKEADAARELGKERLNSGASAGSHSIGVRIKKGMSDEGWSQVRQWANVNNISQALYGSMTGGRMEGLFDLTAQQLTTLKEQAPVFWAKLDGDVRDYLQAIIDSEDSLQEMKDTLNETLTGVTFDSMADDFLSTLQDMDVSAATFANNFKEYMRKALIQNMFNEQFKDKLKTWYQMWSDAMNPDGAGGSTITKDEQAALDTLRDSIITGATNAAQAINKQFEDATADPTTTLSGAISSASQESIDLLAGQTNAVRVNQVVSIDILRQQLLQLTNINLGVGQSNGLLQQIYIQLKTTSDPLRAQGKTS